MTFSIQIHHAVSVLPYPYAPLQPRLDLLRRLAQRIITPPGPYSSPSRNPSADTPSPPPPDYTQLTQLRNLLLTLRVCGILPPIRALVNRHHHRPAQSQIMLQRTSISFTRRPLFAHPRNCHVSSAHCANPVARAGGPWKSTPQKGSRRAPCHHK